MKTVVFQWNITGPNRAAFINFFGIYDIDTWLQLLMPENCYLLFTEVGG